MTKRKPKGFLVVATLAAACVLFGGLFDDRPGPALGSSAARSALTTEAPIGLSSTGSGADLGVLEARVAEAPTDGQALTTLGLAYQERARETGDPRFDVRSRAALERALRLPGAHRWLAVTALSSLAAQQHRFGRALALALRARSLAPGAAVVYGVLGDAYVELGRYGPAFAAFDRMASLKPGVASYARVAYARELLGRTAAARVAARLAVDAAAGTRENAAWALVQLGNLEFATGRLGPAAAAYRRARSRVPGYAHALAGLARVEAARGRSAPALALYRRAVAKAPLPQYAIALGDTARVSGKPAVARRAYALARSIERRFAATGARTERETALFELDHGGSVEAALALAREAFRSAPSIDAEDVLAWALYRSGECAAAERHSERAVRLGTRDALKLFHRGMIERCLGRPRVGRSFLRRALEVNPYFSPLYAPVARRLVR